MKSFRRSKVPASTSDCASRSYSSAEPSHQWIESGWVSSATSSTQRNSFRFEVMAVVSIVTGRFNLSGSERGNMALCHTRPNP